MGAPHSSTALKHCSGVRFFLRMWAGYWIFPQPAQARLQRKSGSSIRTSGIALVAGEFLAQHIGCDGPHLGNWNSHGSKSIPAGGGGLQWVIVSRRKWLILTALSMEAKAIAGEIGWKPGDVDVSIAVIGIRGGRFDRSGLSGFDGVILAGLAGGLDPMLRIGDVVCEGPAEKPWEDLPLRRGKIYTADHLVATAIEKERLFRETGCLAVDMEGEIVRAAAESAGVPFLHIRGISDSAGQSVPERLVNWVDDVGQARAGRVTADLIAHPLLIPSMIRLGKQSRFAVRRVAEAVRGVVQSLRLSEKTDSL